MSRREITVHAFCSVKGGVGKSTLAVACAKLLAQAGETCVVIDADMTGTSLADGLRLRAPKVPLLADGTLDLDAPPAAEYYTVEETRRLRENRAEEKSAKPGDRRRPPVYFNDALHYTHQDENHECRIDSMFWRHERFDGVRYLPSSSIRSDVVGSMGWLYDAEYEMKWQYRVAWLIDEMSRRILDLKHVVIDLPPGVIGFTTAILGLCADISMNAPLPDGWPHWNESGIQWHANPCLVCSQDENDLRLSVEFRRFVHPHIGLRMIINRHTLSDEEVKRNVAQLFPAQNVADDLKFISDKVALGRIFHTGVNDLELGDVSGTDRNAILDAFGLRGAK